MENRILEWIKSEGILEKEETREDSVFNYIVNYPKGSRYRYLIFQPKDKTDLVIVHSGINYPSSEQEKVVSRETFRQLKLAIQEAILDKPLWYSIQSSKVTGAIEKIVIQRPVYSSENYGKTGFMDDLLHVHNTTMKVLLTIKRVLGHEAKTRPLDPHDARVIYR